MSLAVDIALWTLEKARAFRKLEWTLSYRTFGSKDRKTGDEPLSYLPTVEPGATSVYPISQAHALLLTSLVRPDSKGDRDVFARYTSGWTYLGTLYEALVMGEPIRGWSNIG